MNSTINGPLAQLVEQETLNLLVIGSIPIRPTIISLSHTRTVLLGRGSLLYGKKYTQRQ